MAATKRKFPHRPLASAISAALLTVAAGGAHAEYTSSNRDILTPNTGTWSASGVTLGGTTFKVLGLQGVGRFAANAKDAATGESLGSVSDLQITNFNYTGTNANGQQQFSGTFNFLPDRGYNSGPIFSNYAARINAFSFDFTPYTGTGTTISQDQIKMTFTGSQRFTYDHDNNAATAPIYTTGLLPTSSATTLFGVKVPTSTARVG